MDNLQQARFQTLLEPVHEGAIRFCRRLCTTRQDAEDLYHDALVAAWEGLTGLKDDDRFKPWLFRIIANTFRNHERRRRWRGWLRRESIGNAEEQARPLSDMAAVDPRDQYDARRWLARAMGVLSARERVLIVLVELEEYAAADVAAMWDVPEGTIRSRLARARGKMRHALVPLVATKGSAVRERREVDYELRPSQAATE